MKFWKNQKGLRFLLLLLAAFLLLDQGMRLLGTAFIQSGYVKKNDFEVTQYYHPEKAWDKVFYGNSSVTAAYREDLSNSGYVNMGMDYAVITDLLALLQDGYMEVGSELVIGLDYLTFYDNFATNPSYIWLKKPLEPYSYFQRDDLKKMFETGFQLLTGKEIEKSFDGQEKPYYYGSISTQALKEKTDKYETLYYHIPMAEFEKNFAALDKVYDWCENHGVRLRLIWMPWNTTTPAPEISYQIQERCNSWCAEHGVETVDWLSTFSPECFHDVGHLNYEYGAYVFTNEVDKWLNS